MSLKTKNVLTKLTLREPIGFKIIMSSPKVNILKGKEENYFFNCIFILSSHKYLLKCQM